MALNINDTKLKKCNVNSVKCKRINVDSVKVWSAEELIYTNGVQNHELTITEIDRNEAYVTFNSDNFYIYAKGKYGTGGSHISALTTEKIDVTDYSTLHFVTNGSANEFTSSNAFYGVLSTVLGSDPYEHNNGAVNLSGANGEDRTIDLTNITGSYYIGVACNAYQYGDISNSGTVYQIWLD